MSDEEKQLDKLALAIESAPEGLQKIQAQMQHAQLILLISIDNQLRKMVEDNSLKLDNDTTKIFEDIKDICEIYLRDSTLPDIDPDKFITMIKDKISEYDKIYE